VELVGNTFFFQWEVSLIIWLQSHMGSFGTSLASFLSVFGEEMACVAVIGFLYWCYDKRFGRFVGLNTLTKMPFSADYLNSGEMSALLIRMV
jgi:hypothetical protein